MEELRSVFTANLAYAAYVPFLKQIGLESMKSSLKNYVTIHELCRQYKNEFICDQQNSSLPSSEDEELSASRLEHIGSNVALIGNRIDVQITKEFDYFNSSKLFSIVCNKMENTGRHLRGNWLAYWEHEIGRHDKDIMFNFKQIKLQTFSSHVNSVKCLYALDNENSFMSASKDKTIKLWSLRSHGDGSNVSSCQWTYTSHKKAVLAVTLQESMRLAASSDGVVHIWDPFLGQTIRFLDGVRNIPVNTIKSVPTPSCLLLAATTEGTVRILDVRTCSYTHELKINTNAPNLIRCMAVAPSGTWLATGQSSGYITVLDIRTGQIVSMWRAHEGEVLQMVTYGENTLVSSSLDQTVSVWNVQDGKFRFHMKGLSEPVHCLNIYNNELISGTTANRIGVHTSVDSQHSFSSTKLRSDTFKGILTSMALLPMNRLLLLGSDCGNINLLC